MKVICNQTLFSHAQRRVYVPILPSPGEEEVCSDTCPKASLCFAQENTDENKLGNKLILKAQACKLPVACHNRSCPHARLSHPVTQTSTEKHLPMSVFPKPPGREATAVGTEAKSIINSMVGYPLANMANGQGTIPVSRLILHPLLTNPAELCWPKAPAEHLLALHRGVR